MWLWGDGLGGRAPAGGLVGIHFVLMARLQRPHHPVHHLVVEPDPPHGLKEGPVHEFLPDVDRRAPLASVVVVRLAVADEQRGQQEPTVDQATKHRAINPGFHLVAPHLSGLPALHLGLVPQLPGHQGLVDAPVGDSAPLELAVVNGVRKGCRGRSAWPAAFPTGAA